MYGLIHFSGGNGFILKTFHCRWQDSFLTKIEGDWTFFTLKYSTPLRNASKHFFCLHLHEQNLNLFHCFSFFTFLNSSKISRDTKYLPPVAPRLLTSRRFYMHRGRLKRRNCPLERPWKRHSGKPLMSREQRARIDCSRARGRGWRNAAKEVNREKVEEVEWNTCFHAESRRSVFVRPV